jgi:hypothetical protein
MKCAYPYCENHVSRDNVCSTHINTNTHRRFLALDLLHRGASGVRGAFSIQMDDPCAYWSAGKHIVSETGLCRCGTRFAVMEFAP